MKHPYILAIDPGTEKSGWIMLKRDGGLGPNLGAVQDFGVTDNARICADVIPGFSAQCGPKCIMVMEFTESRGQGFFGKEAMRTLWWAGRFRQAWGVTNHYVEVYPREVKRVICGSIVQNDAGIRRAVIDRYPATGGGSEPAVGVKKDRGPLYGVSSHCWRALAAALTWIEDPDYVSAGLEAKGLSAALTWAEETDDVWDDLETTILSE